MAKQENNPKSNSKKKKLSTWQQLAQSPTSKWKAAEAEKTLSRIGLPKYW